MLYTMRVSEESGNFGFSLRKGTETRALADVTH